MKRKPDIHQIRKTLAFIKKDMRRFNMSRFGVLKGSDEHIDLVIEGQLMRPKEWAPCNTKFCFAGANVLVNTPRKEWPSWFLKDGSMRSSVRSRARRNLGLTEDEEYLVFDNSDAIDQDTPSRQLAEVRKALNVILSDHGMTERV